MPSHVAKRFYDSYILQGKVSDSIKKIKTQHKDLQWNYRSTGPRSHSSEEINSASKKIGQSECQVQHKAQHALEQHKIRLL